MTSTCNNDIEDIEDIFKSAEHDIVMELIKLNDSELCKTAINTLKRRHKKSIKNSAILKKYHQLVDSGKLKFHEPIQEALTIKKLKSNSGVIVITVTLSYNPHNKKLTCKWNCYYCPNEEGQPRSYLKKEPAVQRGNRCDFDSLTQMFDRLDSLRRIGHKLDKLEIIVLGGTWESYPAAYREEFIRDLFYAANVYYDRIDVTGSLYYPNGKSYDINNDNDIFKQLDIDLIKKYDISNLRERKSILEEQKINETARLSIIGLTLETRPDTVTHESIRDFRRLGCTRLQIGVQHTDDEILKKVNRQSTISDAKRAIRLLKNAGYKIDIHLMPDLPGSSPEKDNEMFDKVLNDHELQVDQMKIYPTAVTDFTVIKKWYDKGEYKPYAEKANGKYLIDVIQRMRRKIHPWIRLNRIIRDIPTSYIHGGNKVVNLRDILQKTGSCKCIRCREVRGDEIINPVLKIRKYIGSYCTEIFISFESDDEKTIYGFLRLRLPDSRIPKKNMTFPETFDCSLIRELHVYGKMNPKGVNKSNSQHIGLGKALISEAESITKLNGYSGIAVISGVGVREYYRSRGYIFRYDDGQFGIKRIPNYSLLFWRKNEGNSISVAQLRSTKRLLIFVIIFLVLIILSRIIMLVFIN